MASIFQRLFARQPKAKPAPERGPKALVPGRPMSHPSRLEKWGGSILDTLLRSTPRKRDPIEVLAYITNYHPESSLAVWNFVRMAAPEFTLSVTGEDGEADTDAATALMERLAPGGIYGRDYGGGLTNVMRVFVLTLLTQGAAMAELELSDDLKDVLDWCPASPYLSRFVKDRETGHFRLGTDYRGTIYLFPEEQVKYYPLDPNVGDPHGRAPLWSAFEIVFTHAEVLRDLKAVAHFAGWPRLDVKILQEIVEANMPDYLDDPGQEAARKAWLDGYLTDVQSLYNSLEVDDAFVHWDWVEAGSMDAGRPTFDVSKLVAVIERSLVSALKHLPQLLGRQEGSTETHSTVQWQIFAESIGALRGTVQAVVEWMGNQTLRIWGVPGTVHVAFPKLRTQDREREAKARYQEWRTELEMFFAGLVSQDELSQQFAKHAPVADVDYGSLLKIPMLLVAGDGTGGGEGQAARFGSSSGIQNRAAFIPDAPRTNETLLFAQLPAWMRYHQRRWEQSVGAFTDARRWRVFDAIENAEEPGGNGRGAV